MVRPQLAGGVRALYSTVRRTLASCPAFDFSRFTTPAQTTGVPHAASRPALEPLENRQLLSGIGLSHNILWAYGDYTAANDISVKLSGSSNVVVKVNDTSKTYSLSSFNWIQLWGGKHNDRIEVDENLKVSAFQITSWAGNDTVLGGGGNDYIWGGDGDDILDGRSGNDWMIGEAGNDTLYGSTGTDTFLGGTGTNQISQSGRYTGTSLAVTGFTVYNADTDKAVMTLGNGGVIDLASIGTSRISIVANVSGAVGSVKFGYDANSNYRVESAAPYAIAGDTNNGSNLAAWTPSVGSHTLTATPYAGSDATGTAGTGKTISFSVINGSTPSDNDATAPTAVITPVTSTSIMAGQAVHVQALNSKLNSGTPLTSRYQWDFGDSGSKYNLIDGFNAAHIYENAGTYTVRLTITNSAGKSDVVTTTVKVASNTRRKIYISASGSDSNSGLSADKPIKTFARADALMSDNVELLFRRGDTFDVYDGMMVNESNVVIGAYGSGARPVLRYRGGSTNYGTIIYTGSTATNVMVRDLTFTSIYDESYPEAGLPRGVRPSGVNTTILNSEFLHLGYAVHASNNPTGLLVQDNVAPSETALRNYLVYASGSDHVYLGNSAVNTKSHIVRVEGVNRLLIAKNNFANPVDSDGVTRGTVTIHFGTYAYVAGNTFTDGIANIGPLDGADGLSGKANRWKWGVFENNIINSPMIVQHGAERIMIRNNVYQNSGGYSLNIAGYNNTFDRGVVDVSIINNTAVNSGVHGMFLLVGGAVQGINLVNNLYIAPRLITGEYQSAPVYVKEGDLSSFTRIDNNVWQLPNDIMTYAEGGINYVSPDWPTQEGYRTPAEWNAFSAVGTDYFRTTAYSGFTPTSSSFAASAGTQYAGVFTDFYGKLRSSSGDWSVGAVEI